MKKFMKFIVFIAAAAVALASCQKNEIDAPIEKQEVHFTINAGLAETKTYITQGENAEGKTIYEPFWHSDDKLGVLFSAPNAETTTSHMVTFENTSDAGKTASFEGTTSVTENGTFYSFYPASAFSRGYVEGDARLDLKSNQKPTATSFDPACDILVAKPYDYTVNEGSVVADGLRFKRIMAVLKINLNSNFADVQNDFVKSVSFTAAGTKLTGYARIVLNDPEFTGNWASNGDQYETVTANYDSDLVSINGASNSVYLVVAPVTIEENAELTFEIKTAEHNITKTITTHPEMSFSAGNVNVIDLSIAVDNCEEIDTSIDYSGEYLIAGVKSDVWYAATKYESGNYLNIIPFEFKDETVVETDDLKNCYMTIAKVEGGEYDGMYTIQDAGELYLSAVNSNENYLKAVESLSADTYWTLTKEDEDGTFSIVASKSQYTRNDMRFNASSSRVSCYASSSTLAKPVLISTSIVEPDLTPSISVTETAISVGADATSADFTYTVKNITGTPTASVKNDATTMTNVATEVENGTVKVTFDANTEESAKTATIILSYEGAESVEVTITQAAAGAPEWVSTSFAELKEGDQVVIVSTKSSSIYAMSNDKGTSNAPSAVAITYSTGKLSNEPAETVIWYVGVDGDNRIFYADAGKTKWLYCTNTNNGVRVGTNANKSFILNSGYLYNNATNRYIGVYNNADWRCYTSINTNIESQEFYFFVKGGSGESEGEGGETEKTLTSIAVSGQTTEFTVGDAFEFGGTVTATYSDASTADVTASASFSGYNMSTEGQQTVTVTYEGQTTTYVITVSAASGGSLAYTFDIKNYTKTGYGAWTGIAENNNMTWTITCGQGGYLGINKADNDSKIVLGENYSKVGAPLGYSTSTKAVVAVISDISMSNINKIEVVANSVTATSGTAPTKISLVYSSDGTTYSLVETQDYNNANGNIFEFNAISNAYYAVVYYSTAWFRLTGTQIRYYN